MPTTVRSIALALVLATPLLPAGALAGCPPGCLSCRGCSTTSFETCVSATGEAFRDLAHGVTAAVTNSGAFIGEEWASVSDTFVVSGPPSGTRITFTASLRLRGNGYGDLSWTGQLRESVTNQVEYHDQFRIDPILGGIQVDTVVAIPISVAVSDPFTLDHGVSVRTQPFGFTGSNSGLESALAFSGLPPGSRVVSCNGFVQEFTTAARPASWGTVKVRYR